MRVEIVSCSIEEWWHEKYIGRIVEVKEWSHDAWFAIDVEEAGGVLPKRDSKVVKGDNKMSEYTLCEVIEILEKYPTKKFEAVDQGGRIFNAKLLNLYGLYVTTEGLSECVIPAPTIPLDLKWRQK
jgi:hypothetical protein